MDEVVKIILIAVLSYVLGSWVTLLLAQRHYHRLPRVEVLNNDREEPKVKEFMPLPARYRATQFRGGVTEFNRIEALFGMDRIVGWTTTALPYDEYLIVQNKAADPVEVRPMSWLMKVGDDIVVFKDDVLFEQFEEYKRNAR